MRQLRLYAVVVRGLRGPGYAEPALLALPYMLAEARMIATNAAASSPFAWRHTVARILHEGQGMLRLAVFGHDALDAIVAGALEGNDHALFLGRAVARLSIKLDQFDGPSSNGPACLTCRGAFWRERYPHSLVVLSADVPESTACLLLGLCGACHASFDSAKALQAAVVAALHQHFALRVRRLPPAVATMGHA